MVIPGTGVLLNNALGAFSESGPNAVAPGKRMASSMTPTLVSQNGKLVLILGSPGGDTIPNTVAQVFRNLVDYGMTIDQAIAHPRVHEQWFPDKVRVGEAESRSAEGRRSTISFDVATRSISTSCPSGTRTTSSSTPRESLGATPIRARAEKRKASRATRAPTASAKGASFQTMGPQAAPNPSRLRRLQSHRYRWQRRQARGGSALQSARVEPGMGYRRAVCGERAAPAPGLAAASRLEFEHPGIALVLFGTNDDHRARRLASDAIGDRSPEQALETRRRLGGDDDEIGVNSGGKLQDRAVGASGSGSGAP